MCDTLKVPNRKTSQMKMCANADTNLHSAWRHLIGILKILLPLPLLSLSTSFIIRIGFLD